LSDRLRLEVRDNGPGMDIQELKRHLVTSWERREAESTHLGLRVTIHLLAKIGGSISAWSRPGAGAIFSIEFPKHALRVPQFKKQVKGWENAGQAGKNAE